jgi:hypothetical protein
MIANALHPSGIRYKIFMIYFIGAIRVWLSGFLQPRVYAKFDQTMHLDLLIEILVILKLSRYHGIKISS